MHFFAKAALVASSALVPAIAFSQTTEPLTREQVRAELVQLENAGYNPLSNCAGDCPGSLRRAEATLPQREKTTQVPPTAGPSMAPHSRANDQTAPNHRL